MGGYIEVESEPSVGTKFTFTVKIGNFSCLDSTVIKEEEVTTHTGEISPL